MIPVKVHLEIEKVRTAPWVSIEELNGPVWREWLDLSRQCRIRASGTEDSVVAQVANAMSYVERLDLRVETLGLNPTTWYRFRRSAGQPPYSLDIEVNRPILQAGIVGYLFGVRVQIDRDMADDVFLLSSGGDAMHEPGHRQVELMVRWDS